MNGGGIRLWPAELLMNDVLGAEAGGLTDKD